VVVVTGGAVVVVVGGGAGGLVVVVVAAGAAGAVVVGSRAGADVGVDERAGVGPSYVDAAKSVTPPVMGVGAGGTAVVVVEDPVGAAVLRTGMVTGPGPPWLRAAGSCPPPPGPNNRSPARSRPTTPSPANIPRRCERGGPASSAGGPLAAGPDSTPLAFMSIHSRGLVRRHGRRNGGGRASLR
jgi:hypothetical protein